MHRWSPRHAVAATSIVAAVSGAAAVVTSSGAWAIAAGAAAIATAAVSWRTSVEPGGQTEIARTDHAEGPDPEPLPGIGEVSATPRPENQMTSGLVDEATLATMLRNRLAVARRTLRPLSVVFVEVDEVDGLPETDAAVGIRCTVREADVAGRRDDGLFVLVLDETGEDGAVWTCERLRRTLTADRPGRRFRAGVASYPGHGLDAVDLEAKAAEALTIARQWHVDRIEVADST